MKRALGLVGLLALSSNAVAQDTGYNEMSRPAITQVLKKKAVNLNETNFQKEVLDYDGAVMILFDSTCNRTQEADVIDRNMDLVYLGLIDKFDNSMVNGLELKFTYFDGCGTYVQLPKGFFSQVGVTTTETHMYLDGRKIDIAIGGPTDEVSIKARTKNMTYWINYNLLGITEPGEENIVLLYGKNTTWKEYPRSVLER